MSCEVLRPHFGGSAGECQTCNRAATDTEALHNTDGHHCANSGQPQKYKWPRFQNCGKLCCPLEERQQRKDSMPIGSLVKYAHTDNMDYVCMVKDHMPSGTMLYDVNMVTPPAFCVAAR